LREWIEGASSELGRALEEVVRPVKDFELVRWAGERTGAVGSDGRPLIELVALVLVVVVVVVVVVGGMVVAERGVIFGRELSGGGAGADR
jgi:hypothetical protein